uniref:Uncharacterized protein n=2 Tax=Opuntia streptacantha TaxID=393608 RepID=A0A7C8Z555_OPUST
MPVRRQKKPPNPPIFSLQSFIYLTHALSSYLPFLFLSHSPQILDLGMRFGLASVALCRTARSPVEVIAGIGVFPCLRRWETPNSGFACRYNSQHCIPLSHSRCCAQYGLHSRYFGQSSLCCSLCGWFACMPRTLSLWLHVLAGIWFCSSLLEMR